MSANECGCGRPTSGAPLCEQCQVTFGYAIANVAAYFVDLEVVSTKRTRYGSQGASKGSIGKAQPLPVDHRFVDAGPAPADDKSARPRGAAIAPGNQLRWDVANTVTAWTRDIVSQQPPVPGPACRVCIHASCTTIRRRRAPGATVTSMVRYLAGQFRWILNQPWSPAMMGEFLDLERRLVRFVDSKPSTWYAGKCSHRILTSDGDGDRSCQAELYATADKGTIVCGACGAKHDVADRRDFLLSEAKNYLVTATEAAGALLAWTDYDGSETKLIDRIQKWRAAGRIEARSTTEVGGKDRHLYRLGDIQDRMVDDAQHRQTKRIGGAA